MRCRFNPRPREGGDLRGKGLRVNEHWFQSAPPRGGRPAQADDDARAALSFNPRPREGGDLRWEKP